MRLRALAYGSVLLLPALAHADDWSLTRPSASPPRAHVTAPAVTQKPEDAGARELLRARYLKLVLRDPSQRFALDRLLASYRERDGNLDTLARELAAAPETGADAFGVLMLRGRVSAARAEREAARADYERAAELAPASPEPWIALSELAREAGELSAASQALERARDHTKDPHARSELERQLAELALERGEFELAETIFTRLAASRSGDAHAATEFARALAQRGEHARAVAAYQRALGGLRGDDRVLAPILLELARSQLELPDGEAALATLERAHALSAPNSGERFAIDEARLEAHRRLGKLDALASELAAERDRSASEAELLARVYDELGDPKRALEALRAALARNPRSIGARERMIRILTQQGELEQAIAQYRVLLNVAPREPRFVLELAKLLDESGKRAAALTLLEQSAQRFAGDAALQRALYELYSRWGEKARANAVLARLSRIEPDDPSYFVALGEQRLEQGDQAGALELWRRMLEVMPDKARAHTALADTYLDHDMPDRALAEFEAAVKLAPQALEPLRGLAETLEKLQRAGEAAKRWQELLEFTNDRAQKREARRRLARLWAASGELSQHIAELERAFGWPEASAVSSKHADIEAGRTLAECYHALANGRLRGQGDPRYLDLSERVLVRVLALAPGDVESMLALEHLRTLRGNLAGALEILARLVDADPKHASEYLTRMAEHALALYRDDEAIGYAERLVALNPNDSKAYERLGDLYRTRQNPERAIASYERAVALDPNAFGVELVLSDLYLAHAEAAKADKLLEHVLRACPDEELVRRAGRALLHLELGAAHLRELEQSLLPLSLAPGRSGVYRALLIELYDVIARPLFDAAREPGPTGTAAHAELRAIAQRAVAPLLSALADSDPTQRRVAIDLLGELRSEQTAVALVTAAEREGDVILRRHALIAAGRAPQPSLAKRFSALANAPERRLRDAGAWALARTRSPDSERELRALLASNTPAVRGYAMLGLGRMRDRAALEEARQALRSDRSGFVRGAAALALGLYDDRASLPALAIALRTEQGETAAAVALALGMLGDRTAAEALAFALFASDPLLRRPALVALRWLARPNASPRPLPPELAEPDDRPSLQPELDAWLALDGGASIAATVHAFDGELRAAAEAALSGPPETARVALALLAGRDPVLEAAGAADACAPLVAELHAPLSALVAHPDPALRAAALGLLGAYAPSDVAQPLVAALEDGDEQVQIAALDRIGPTTGRDVPEALMRAASIAAHDSRFWLRIRAVDALGRAGGAELPRALAKVLSDDAYAYVREAAARALAAAPAGEAVPLLAGAVHDPEPRVRLAAARSLEQLGTPAAAQALDQLDAPTRAALEHNRGRN